MMFTLNLPEFWPCSIYQSQNSSARSDLMMSRQMSRLPFTNSRLQRQIFQFVNQAIWGVLMEIDYPIIVGHSEFLSIAVYHGTYNFFP